MKTVRYFLIFSVILAGAFTPTTYAQDKAEFDIENVFELLRNDKLEDAISNLEAHLTESPGDWEARSLRGSLELRKGEPENAVKIWEIALEHDPSAEDLPDILWNIGHAAMQMGEDGPFLKRIGKVKQFSPRPEGATEKDEEDWKLKWWKRGANSFQKISELYPEDMNVVELAATCLSNGNDEEAAADLWKTVYEKDPENISAGVKYASILRDNGDLDTSREIADTLLSNAPFSQEVHQLDATLHEIAGEEELAKIASEKVEFYDWLPPFSEVEFSEENIRIVTELRGGDAPNSRPDFASLGKLIADTSKSSSGILAAICFRHMAHGPIENQCFEELEKRKDEEILVKLLKQGTSTCTMKQSLFALARLKNPEVMGFVEVGLPQDIRQVWNLDVAGAAAILGDPAAVPMLIEAAAVEFLEKDRQMPEEEASFLGDGPLFARFRAINALGFFTTPEATAALNQGLKNPDIQGICKVALFRQNPTPERWKDVEEATKNLEDRDQLNIARFAMDIPAPEIEALTDRIIKQINKSAD